MFTVTIFGRLARKRAARWPVAVAVLGLAASAPGQEERVDAELLLLVDTSIVVSSQDFADLLEGYAAAIESTSFTQALMSESRRGIAATMVFFGGAGTEQVAVPWMRLNDDTDAAAFADLIRNAARPAPSVLVSFSDGLGYATEQFGGETGFSANGFQSDTQAINVTSETLFLPGEFPGTVGAASQAALNAGVDVINAITVGAPSGLAAAYYNANIVGGQSEGVPGGVVNAPSYADLPTVAAGALTSQLLSLVPEPQSTVLLALALAGFAHRRRRI